MATIVTRAIKGSPLTITEMDSNFTNLNTDLVSVRDGSFEVPLATNLSQTIAAGTSYIYEDSAIVSGFYATPTEVKNSLITQTGTYRTSFELAGTVGNDSYAQVYKNGVAFGTLRVVSNSAAYQTFTEDLAFTVGDTLQIMATTLVAATTTYVKNFKIGVDKTGLSIIPIPVLLTIGVRM